jgi:hypothetical protein
MEGDVWPSRRVAVVNDDRVQRRVSFQRLLHRDVRASDNTTPFFALIGDKSRRFCDAPPTGSSAIFANCSLISGNIALFSTKIQNALRAANLRKLALLCLL